jgi:hypothetical protein
MEFAANLLPRRCRDFIAHTAVAAVIAILTSLAAAQAPAQNPPTASPSEDLKKYPGLLAEFGQLLKKMQDGVQFPPLRGQSRLLTLLPESTIFYVALPNYGDAFQQALTIFQQEVRNNAELRAWWEHAQLSADGIKPEDSLERFYQFSQYLGDEIVVAGANEGGKDPSPLLLAEVRKPGLKLFIQQAAKELAGKSPSPVRVLDVAELAAAKDTIGSEQLLILVRPDFVLAAPDLTVLRSFNALVDHNSRAFAAVPFGQRLARGYEGGASIVAGLDLQNILGQIPPEPGQNPELLRRSGFGDVKYLVLEHKRVAGEEASQMELSFTGPRHGIASWLAAPGPMGSVDFVSPKALMVASVLLKDPVEIFDEFTEMATVSNPNMQMQLAGMEEALKISWKKDLFAHLGGEITIELDSLNPPDPPVWEAMVKTNDAPGLSATISTLLAAAKLEAERAEEDGVTYHTVQVPSGPKTMAIAYAFVDGYLIVGSSHEVVAGAIRLHRSGESLGKSKKFLASLPPGNLSEVSALLYEDPVAMAALSLRQVSPEMAQLFSQAPVETAATVICGYGEEAALREASRSGGVDAGAVLVIAAIAIPNLLRARTAANEASAAATIRTANVAQVTYVSAYPQKGYARDFASLGPDPRGPAHASADHASLIDATLGNPSCTSGAWCTKSGYQFAIKATCNPKRCGEYVVVGTPVSSSTGARSFCSIADAVVRVKTGAPLTSPASAAECLTWPPLQ